MLPNSRRRERLLSVSFELVIVLAREHPADEDVHWRASTAKSTHQAGRGNIGRRMLSGRPGLVAPSLRIVVILAQLTDRVRSQQVAVPTVHGGAALLLVTADCA